MKSENTTVGLPQMLSVRQVAEVLGISVSSVYRLVDAGELQKLKVGARTLFERENVQQYIVGQRAAATAPARGTGIGPHGEQMNAVVLLSGGLDSSTVLAMAVDQGFRCYALSFAYGQRHHVELEAARAVAAAAGVARHVEVNIDLRVFGGSALTDSIDVPKHESVDELGEDIPITYVPARNSVFLSFALAYAETVKADDVFIGVNALDYSGYPDCRPEYIAAYERMANLATERAISGHRLRIHTPLIQLTKAETIRRGLDLGVDYGMTRSCYDPSDAGTACGHCDSCLLRLRGFAENGIADPAPYQPQAAAA